MTIIFRKSKYGYRYNYETKELRSWMRYIRNQRIDTAYVQLADSEDGLAGPIFGYGWV